MSDKLELLLRFYRTADKTQAKLETADFSAELLERLRRIGTVDYAEFKNGTFSFRLSGLRSGTFEALAGEHLAGRGSVCCYFDRRANDLFAANVDSEFMEPRDAKIFTLYYTEGLTRYGLHPLITRSGHGYHIWCRLQSAVENAALRELTCFFIVRAAALTVRKGGDLSHLQCICYPRGEQNDISLRMFGGRHPGSGRFCPVATAVGPADTLLSEEDSWLFFERYLEHAPVSSEAFAQALARVRCEQPRLEEACRAAGNPALMGILEDQKRLGGFRMSRSAPLGEES